jgi:UDP-N-acetylmuramate dehydrogenase
LGLLLEELAARGERPFILGGGTNVLFPDEDFSRPIISTERLGGLEVCGNLVRAQSGVRLGWLFQTAIRHGLGGLEGFTGIPGTAGGAVMMNAGGGGWNFGDRVREIGLFPISGGPMIRVQGSEVEWGYRRTSLQDFVVAWVSLELEPDDSSRLRERAGAFLRRKIQTQPLGESSAGCVFRNPPGQAAAKLIEELGLKGLSSGGAKVSERHANFIVNATGKARASDVVSLVEDLRTRVARTFGIRLETEIVMA